jgi:hypothetical protein
MHTTERKSTKNPLLSTISLTTITMIKVDIYEQGRFKGTLRVKDKWKGIVPIDEEELRQEIETRLPTLKHSNYTISFH